MMILLMVKIQSLSFNSKKIQNYFISVFNYVDDEKISVDVLPIALSSGINEEFELQYTNEPIEVDNASSVIDQADFLLGSSLSILGSPSPMDVPSVDISEWSSASSSSFDGVGLYSDLDYLVAVSDADSKTDSDNHPSASTSRAGRPKKTTMESLIEEKNKAVKYTKKYDTVCNRIASLRYQEKKAKKLMDLENNLKKENVTRQKNKELAKSLKALIGQMEELLKKNTR